MKIAFISANCGNFDPQFEWEPQVLPDDIKLSIHRLNDQNWPLRHRSMTAKLQPGIAKMFGWQMFPKNDIYIWMDASRTLTSTKFVSWMISNLGDANMALFLHPERNTIRSEYEYVKERINRKSKYLHSRYSEEWLDEQMEAIESDPFYIDDTLYASTSFIYRPTESVKKALIEWWYHKTRYLIHDQLALPYVVWKHGVKVNKLKDDIFNLPYWENTRNKK